MTIDEAKSKAKASELRAFFYSGGKVIFLNSDRRVIEKLTTKGKAQRTGEI